MTERQIAILGIVGGVMVIAGSLLPWATITTGLGTVSVNGTQGDGVFTLGLGAVIALASFGRYGSSVMPWARWAIAALGVLTLVIAAQDARAVTSPASIGTGLFVVFLGGAAALLAGAKGKPAPPAS